MIQSMNSIYLEIEMTPDFKFFRILRFLKPLCAVQTPNY